MITKVESFLKKKEPKGLLRFDFRGDGKLDIDWEKEKAPETQVSSAFIGWLRDKHEGSIKLVFEIPIVFVNIHKGAKHILINPTRLPYYLNLQQSDMNALQRDGLIHPEVPVKIFKPKIDYPALAQNHRQKLENGIRST